MVLLDYTPSRGRTIKRFIALLHRVTNLKNPPPSGPYVTICGAAHLPRDHDHTKCCGQRYNSSPQIIYIESCHDPATWWPKANTKDRERFNSMITKTTHFNDV